MFYHQVSCVYCTPEHQPGIGDDDDNVDGVEVMVTSFISLWEVTSCNDKQHSGLRFIALCSCETLNKKWRNNRFSETPHCIICDALSTLIVIVIMVMVILQRGSKRWNPFGKQKTCEQPHPGSRKKTTQAAWPPTFDGDDQTWSPKLILIITIVTTAAMMITTICISRITTTLICYGIGGDELVFSQKERRRSSNVIPKMKDKYDERLLDRGAIFFFSTSTIFPPCCHQHLPNFGKTAKLSVYFPITVCY